MVLRILKFNTIFFLLSLLFFNISNANQIIGTPYIVDGDTIKINNFKIRFFGIDAPEIKQTCMLNNIEWECGKESKNFLINIIDNENIRCEVLNKDMYKRLICECFIKDRNITLEQICNELNIESIWPFMTGDRTYMKSYKDN